MLSNIHKEPSMLQQFPMYAYIPAQDVVRARQFYEQKVGLKPGELIAGGVAYQLEGGVLSPGRGKARPGHSADSPSRAVRSRTVIR